MSLAISLRGAPLSIIPTGNTKIASKALLVAVILGAACLGAYKLGCNLSKTFCRSARIKTIEPSHAYNASTLKSKSIINKVHNVAVKRQKLPSIQECAEVDE